MAHFVWLPPESRFCMSRFLLAILLFLSAFAVVAQGILVYQSSANMALVVEEETNDDKPVSKEAKDLGKENIAFFPGFYRGMSPARATLHAPHSCFACPRGFCDKPYNPPELV
jgi:hypothetical protein